MFPGCHASLKSWLAPFKELINTLKGETEILVTKSIFKLSQETLFKTAIENWIKRLTVNFINKSYFLYDKSNLIKETLITDINTRVLMYGSISYFVEIKNQNTIF